MEQTNIEKTLIVEGLESIVLRYGESGPDTRVDISGTPYLTGIKYLAKEHPPVTDGVAATYRNTEIEAVIFTIRIEPKPGVEAVFTAMSVVRADPGADGRITTQGDFIPQMGQQESRTS